MQRASLADLPPLAPPSGVEVRLATDADAEGIAVCLGEAFSDTAWDAARARTRLLGAAEVEAVFVATAEGRILATASLAHQPAQFADAAVVHWVGRRRGDGPRGLGMLCSLAVLHGAAARGRTSACLLTDDHRLAAIRTYRALGFAPLLRHPSHAARWAMVEAALA